MKIIGIHNTINSIEKSLHQVPRLLFDKSNHTLCINRKLLELFEIKKGDKAFLIFIEDEKGKLCVARTNDETIGFKIWWYKTDTRGRIFHMGLIKLLFDKFKIKNGNVGHHFILNSEFKTVGDYNVLQIISSSEFKREKVSRY